MILKHVNSEKFLKLLNINERNIGGWIDNGWIHLFGAILNNDECCLT